MAGANKEEREEGRVRGELGLFSKPKLPSEMGQLREFGCTFSRRKLVRRLEMGRMLRNVSRVQGRQLREAEQDLHSSCLYELERMARECNEHLASALSEFARNDLAKAPGGATTWCQRDEHAERAFAVLQETRRSLVGRNQFSTMTSGSSDSDSGVLSLASNEATRGSTASREFCHVATSSRKSTPPRRADSSKLSPPEFGLLARHVELRSSAPMRRIVAFSCNLFEQLLTTSHLLHLNLTHEVNSPQATSNNINLSQLKLIACVECQKLRAVLRFDWLAKCFWFAFDNYRDTKTRDDEHEISRRKEQSQRLPPIQSDQLAPDYWRHLTHLIGRLLRDHFLERALDNWHYAVVSHLKGSPSERWPPKLVVRVELLELDDGQLAASKPGELIASGLAFVVHELVETSSNLQLAISEREGECLTVLPPGDTLIETKLDALDEALRSTAAQKGMFIDWVPREYLRVIEIVNKFRSNELEMNLEDELERLDADQDSFACRKDERMTQEEFQSNDDVDRKMRELRATCKQMRLLERLEFKLACKLARHFDFGRLIRLDCLELRQKLLRVINTERSLIIKLNADNILKQMDSLRLHLDELELQIDLESALEDYLNKRWQIKQSQQPDLDQQLLLDSNLEALNLGVGEELEEEALFQASQERELAERVRARSLVAGSDDLTNGSNNKAYNLLDRDQSGHENELIGLDDKMDNHVTLKHELIDGGGDPQIKEEAEDAFANALVGNNNPNVAHLFALSNPNGVPLGEMVASGELGVGSRGLAPLIECRLLLGRYEYLSNFLENDLAKFKADLQFALNSGLVFLTEYLPSMTTNNHQHAMEKQHLDASQMELVRELSIRRRELLQMLAESLRRLDGARDKLRHSNESRSMVLNRNCLEFDWLMEQLSNKQLATMRNSSSLGDLDLNATTIKRGIKHLDLIQDTSSWAQKLEMRRDFLLSQSDLLHKEAELLLSCDIKFEFNGLFEQLEKSQQVNANSRKQANLNDDATQARFELEFELRNRLVKQWAHFVAFSSSFWRLVDEFETQQVKWLNSDSKKLNYASIEHLFEVNFASNLQSLYREVAELRQISETTRDFKQLELCRVSEENLNELNKSFDEFSRKYMPIFKFLTNKHLTHEHWIKLSELINNHLATSSTASQLVSLSELQVCSTVAQLLEFNVQLFVDQLEEMSRQATVEHELTSLLQMETSRLDELARRQNAGGRQLEAPTISLESQMNSLEVCARLDSWTEEELTLAARRFLEFRLATSAGKQLANQAIELHIETLARQLVACHSFVKRYLKLRGEMNLMLMDKPQSLEQINSSSARPLSEPRPHQDKLSIEVARVSQRLIVLRSNTLLSTSQQVRASLLLEFLRLFTQTWLETSFEMSAKLERVQVKLQKTSKHLEEIDELLDQVKWLSARELQRASCESEASLAKLQRDSMHLELEREILATREALAMERQREALRARDICIRQVSERAIPAIRAATKALDCLGDGRSLRALRSYRPRPPLAIRLVIEAVCLLRNATAHGIPTKPLELSKPSKTTTTTLNTSSYATSPMRRFDALRGQIIEDYWPIAWRTLNGLHTCKFISDLRQVGKRPIPRQVIQFIRRKYLSRAEFQVANIERISLEVAHLARWLIAVDVFDRVINIVKPNYEQYVTSERNLSELLADVGHKRQQINTIGRQLEQMQEMIHKQVHKQATLIDLMADCSDGSAKMQKTRSELEGEKQKASHSIDRLRLQIQRLARKCLWQTARLVYLDALEEHERRPLERLLRKEIRRVAAS